VTTTDARPAVFPSALADLRDMPLAKVSSLNAVILDEAIRRVIPEVAAAADTSFNSAI
jgi:hypothetical protein